MIIQLLASTADINYFTGFESMRIQNLLLFLSILSLVVWALVILSIVIRFSAKIMLIYRTRNRSNRQ